jgi:hypothetical protein
MADVMIQGVRFDEKGRLRVQVHPSRPSGYAYIYRAAMNVAWEDSIGELYVHDQTTPVEEFKRILAAVADEYGDRLLLSSVTSYVGVSSDVIAALQDSSHRPSRL